MKSLFLILVLGLFLNQNANADQHFHKVMTVIFENTDYQAALNQDFFASFAAQGALLTNFNAELHPSQGNYISLIAGNNFQVSGDEKENVDQLSIVDLLEAKGLTWKVYAEGYPGNCFLSNSGKYVRKHNPFVSIVNIQNNPARCANIVNAEQLAVDIENNQVPDYSFYVPNLDNDAHDTGVEFANDWFKNFFGLLMQDPKFMTGMALIATFDESGPFGGNQVYTAIVGEGIKPGIQSATEYNHFSLLKMIEDNFALGTLNQKDLDASSISDIWAP